MIFMFDSVGIAKSSSEPKKGKYSQQYQKGKKKAGKKAKTAYKKGKKAKKHYAVQRQSQKSKKAKAKAVQSQRLASGQVDGSRMQLAQKAPAAHPHKMKQEDSNAAASGSITGNFQWNSGFTYAIIGMLMALSLGFGGGYAFSRYRA
jgi:hypothetical protein